MENSVKKWLWIILLCLPAMAQQTPNLGQLDRFRKIREEIS